MTESGAQVLAPFGARTVRVTRRERHGAYIVLSCSDPDGPRPAAGQFYMLMTIERWGGDDAQRPFLPRAFSVLRAPPAGEDLWFLIEDVGPGTRRLGELAPGHGLSLVGPLGNGFSAPPRGRRPVLVGGGVGLAPLAILQDQLGAGALALLGFRDGEHVPGAALLSDARIATDDGSAGHPGLVTDLLVAELDADRAAVVYACGPPRMLEAVRQLCTARQVPAQLALESGMACGFGACFGCVVATRAGYVRLCVDGPVLAAASIGPAALSGAGAGH